jgi:hypothetical protein
MNVHWSESDVSTYRIETVQVKPSEQVKPAEIVSDILRSAHRIRGVLAPTLPSSA